MRSQTYFQDQVSKPIWMILLKELYTEGRRMLLIVEILLWLM